jgi:hypothetical protein
MTAGQLEWFVADGIQRFDPKFTWALGERARAPEGLRYGAEVEKTEQTPTPPPTAAEVDEAIAELKKSRGGWRGAIEHYTVLLRSDQPAAIKYVETQLRGGRGFMTPIALTSIADVSPVEWAPLLCEFVDDRDAGHRESAARGLAKMADEKSAKAVKKQLRSEKEPAVRAWLVRAAVTTSPKDKATIAAVEKVLADDEDATVRMHAAVAAGALEDKAAARRLMQQALADGDPNVRSASAYAMAASRDQDYAEVLEQALAGERDAETKYWIELAVATLREQRDLREFRRFRTEVLGERFGVDRNRGGAGGGEPGGGGSGRPGGG